MVSRPGRNSQMMKGDHGCHFPKLTLLLAASLILGSAVSFAQTGDDSGPLEVTPPTPAVEAAAAFDRALLRVPADARTRYQLALLFQAMGRPDEALAHLRGAVHVWRNADPEHALANEARARLADWEGRS